MSDQSSAYFYQNPNNKAKASYWQGASRGDKWAAAISLLAVIASATASYQDRLHFGWFILILLVLAGLNAHVEYAKMYKELQGLVIGGYIAVVLRDVLWEAEPSASRAITWLRDRGYRLSDDARARVPLRLEFVQAHADRFGVLNELDSDTGYMYVAADGSAYNDLDLEDQQRVHKEISLAVNTFFGTADRRVGVTMLRVTRPENLMTIDETMRDSGDPTVVYPEHFDLDEQRAHWAAAGAQLFAELKPTARAFGASRSWQMMVITFKWDDEAKQAAKGKLSDEQIGDRPLIELGRTLHHELAAIGGLELQNPHVLSPVELSEFIRGSLTPNIESIESYYKQKAYGEIVSDEDDLEIVTPELVQQYPQQYRSSDIGTVLSDLKTWMQKRIVVKSDRVLIDDTWFMTVRYTTTPEQEHPTKAQRVHFAVPRGKWDSVAIVSERTSGNIDTRVVMTGEAARRSLEDAKDHGKIVADPRKLRRRQRAETSMRQMSDQSVNQRYLGTHVLTADSSRQLTKDLKSLRTRLRGQGIVVSPIKGRVRVFDAALTGAIGVSRL